MVAKEFVPAYSEASVTVYIFLVELTNYFVAAASNASSTFYVYIVALASALASKAKPLLPLLEGQSESLSNIISYASDPNIYLVAIAFCLGLAFIVYIITRSKTFSWSFLTNAIIVLALFMSYFIASPAVCFVVFACCIMYLSS